MIEYVTTTSTGSSVKCHPTNAAHRDQTVADVGALRFGEVRGKRFRATPRRSTPNPKQVSSVSGAGDRGDLVVMNTCSSTAGVASIDSPALARRRSGDEVKRRLIARPGRICVPRRCH
jgi:hypothetical protein